MCLLHVGEHQAEWQKVAHLRAYGGHKVAGGEAPDGRAGAPWAHLLPLWTLQGHGCRGSPLRTSWRRADSSSTAKQVKKKQHQAGQGRQTGCRAQCPGPQAAEGSQTQGPPRGVRGRPSPGICTRKMSPHNLRLWKSAWLNCRRAGGLYLWKGPHTVSLIPRRSRETAVWKAPGPYVTET